MSHLAEIIRSRRSIRVYDQTRSIPQEVLEHLLEMARWGPSAHNRQPWRFAVVTQSETQARLAAAMGARLRADLSADGLAPELIEQDAARSYSRITGAAALICVCLSMADMDQYPDPQRARNEEIMAAQSVAMASQNLLLAAHEIGLGACWMCAPLFCSDVVANVLQLPSDWQPQGLITLGYPAQTRERSRKPIEDFTVWR